jgi:hypothetical protein
MVIELDSEQSATITIHPDDDPFILAKAFCFQYSIDPRVINTLANNIRNVKNLEFTHSNSQSFNYNHNRSKLSSSGMDQKNKENNSSLINQSINESFSKGDISMNTKHKNLDRSSMVKNLNDTTMLSNGFSRQSVFDRLYQDSRKKKTIKNGIENTHKKDNKISQSILQESNISADPCLLIY